MGGAWAGRGGGAGPGAGFFLQARGLRRRAGDVGAGGGRRAAMGCGWGLLVGLLGALWLLRSGHGEERRPETAAQRCFCQVRRARGRPTGCASPSAGDPGARPGRRSRSPRASGPCDGCGRLDSLSHSVPASCSSRSSSRSRVHKTGGSGVDPAPGHLVRAVSRASPAFLLRTDSGTGCSPALAVVVKRLNDLAWLFGCPGPTAWCLGGPCCPLTPRPVYGALSSS